MIHITEMPIKCPVAPLEFAFLADWWLTQPKADGKTVKYYVADNEVGKKFTDKDEVCGKRKR